MIDLLLITGLGFLGSFGHCAGMCGPIVVAFALSRSPQVSSALQFHFFLNLGRLATYGLVGGLIGGLGSLLVAGGQLAGVGSGLRQGMTMFTGIVLIWLGVTQIQPRSLPSLPFIHPLLQTNWHDRWHRLMLKVAGRSQWWTPLVLGAIWGLIPCGFLYIAQIKAAETGNFWQGAATMCCFGLGTMPTMIALGIFSSQLSRDRRSQLFRLGGWLTLGIGVLTFLRNDAHTDFTGHAALVCLVLAAIARPISVFGDGLLRYRRALGVGGFLLSCAHILHMTENTLQWNFEAVSFLVAQHQWGIGLGAIAFILLVPLAITSFDWWQNCLGKWWRSLHLLSIPALVLVAGHSLLIGSHYLGGFRNTWQTNTSTVILVMAIITTLSMRSPKIWSFLAKNKLYVAPKISQK